MKCIVIIPAYNESEKIAEVIDKVKEFCDAIIVVDDGSKDDTAGIAEKKGVKVLRHCINLGKGATLKTGCDYAYNNHAEKMIVIDADGQHDPREIPKFLEKLEEVDIVFSHRQETRIMPFVLRFGNKFINKTLRVLSGINIKDSQCGYRAFTRKAYENVRWDASDYFMETEMIMKTAKNRLKYASLPIETIYNDKYKGTTVLDGVKIVLKMLAWRFFK